ncbi:hypothetical protein Vafri_19250 [Volvox africanus]|uniref:Uncharacterized protein n=1 Tax=Volvox africanus TaxID=51714 RepID=A0A8J4BU62_9CHLO|nr:hypothetical protein Vafri_19250 [Volvox africanus]
MTSRCRRSDAATGVNDRYLHVVAISLAVAAGGLTLALGVVGKGRRRGRQDRGKVTQCTGAACKVAFHERDDQVLGSFPSQGQSCPEKQSDDASLAIQAHLRDAQASQPDCSVVQGDDGLDTRDSDTETNTDVASPIFLESLTAVRVVSELQESGILELRTDVLSSCGHMHYGFEPDADGPTRGELVYDASVTQPRLSSRSGNVFDSSTMDSFTAPRLPRSLHDSVHDSGASTLEEQSSAKSWASAEGVSLDGIVHSDDEIIEPNDSREGPPKPNDGLDVLCDGGDLRPSDGFLSRTDPKPPDVPYLLTPTAGTRQHDGTQMQVEASSIFDGLQEGLMPHGAFTLELSHTGELRRRRNGGDGGDDGDDGGHGDGGCGYPPGLNLDLDSSSLIDVALSGTTGAGSSNCSRAVGKSYNGRCSGWGTEDTSAGRSSCLNGFRSSLEVTGGVDLLVTIAIGNPLFAKDASNTPGTPTASRGPSASRVGWCTASPAPRDVGLAADSASSGDTLAVGAFPIGGGDGNSGRARRHLSFTPMFLAIDNPCFVGPATAAVFNPCFSSAEWRGAVPAVHIDLPVCTGAPAAGPSEVRGSGDGFATAAIGGGGDGGSVRWHPCNPLAATAVAVAVAAGVEGVQGGPAAAVAAALPSQERQPEAAGTVAARTVAVHRDLGELHESSMAASLWGPCPNTPCWSYAVKEQQQESQGKEHDDQQKSQRLGHRARTDGAAAAEGEGEGEQAEVIKEEAVEIEVVKGQSAKAANPLNWSELAPPMTPAKQPPPLAAPLPGSPTSPTSPWQSSAAQVAPRPASEINDPVAVAAADAAAADATAVNVASVSSSGGAAAAAAATAPIGIDACGPRRHSRWPNPGLCLIQPPVPTPLRTYSRPPHPFPRPAARPLSSSPAPSKQRQQEQHYDRHHVDYHNQQQQLVCGSPGMSARSASTRTDRSNFRGSSSAASTSGASAALHRSFWRPTAATGSQMGTGSAAKSPWPAASAGNRDMNLVVAALTGTTTTAASAAFKGSARCCGMQGLLTTPAAVGGTPPRAASRPPFRPPSKFGGGFQLVAHGGGGDTTTMAKTAAAPVLTHGPVDRKLPEGASNLPSYMRPTQASLAAGSGGGASASASASKSVAAMHGGGGGGCIATIGERKAQDQQDPKRPRWR